MAEAAVAGAYVAEHLIEGVAVTAYGVAKSTMPLRGSWKQIDSKIPLPRSSHSLVVIAGKAYIFGGEVEPRVPADNDVHVFTLPSGIVETTDYNCIESEYAPPPRVGHSAVAIGRWMYVFGGRGGKDVKPLQEQGRVWCFDTKTGSWSAIDPIKDRPTPEARSYHASAAVEHSLLPKAESETEDKTETADAQQHGTIFIHAGCAASGRFSDLWCFDVATRAWKQLPDAPGPARSGSALVCTSKRLYRFGGFDGNKEVGGQIDVLDLGKEVFVDKSDVAGASVIAGQRKEENWERITVSSPKSPFPGDRSVAGLHHVTTGQGRNYLILVFGEKTPSGAEHDAAGSFWDDVWAFQLKSDDMSSANIKDAARMVIGMKTRVYDWAEVQIPEVFNSEGRVSIPSERGWFASSGTGDLDRSGILLWGGINSKNESLGDSYWLTVESI